MKENTWSKTVGGNLVLEQSSAEAHSSESSGAQWSLLQIFAALATLAVMITVNIRVERVPFSFHPDGSVREIYTCSGWPFRYWESIYLVRSGPRDADLPSQLSIHGPALLGNVLTGSLFIWGILRVTRNRPRRIQHVVNEVTDHSKQ